jgi:arsenate reductase
LAFIENSKKEFKIINYLINPPTFDELSVVIEKLQLDPLDLVRQKKKFGLKTLKIKIECTRNHSSHGLQSILIERPIVIKESSAIVGRDLKKSILSSKSVNLINIFL